MSAIPASVGTAVAAVKAPLNWAKARPFVFVGLVVLIAVLSIKFAPTILRWLGKTPVVGSKVVAFAQQRDAA